MPPIMDASIDAAGDDRITPFQIGDSAIRGRIVRLGGAIDAILAAHPFATGVKELVGEAALLAAMMGSALKFDGRMIFQMQGDGPLSMLVSDFTSKGALRATASIAEEPPHGAALETLIGKGHVAVTVDQGPDMERYQGIAPAEGATLSDVAVQYFRQSEQIPTAIKLAVGRLSRPGAPEMWRAGGVIAQYIPSQGGDRARGDATPEAPDEREAWDREAWDREAWDRAAAFLATTGADELIDPSLSSARLLYRLFHEDGVRVFDAAPVRAHCPCNAERIAPVLARYDEEGLADLVEDGAIRVTCEFCRRVHLFNSNGAPMPQ